MVHGEAQAHRRGEGARVKHQLGHVMRSRPSLNPMPPRVDDEVLEDERLVEHEHVRRLEVQERHCAAAVLSAVSTTRVRHPGGCAQQAQSHRTASKGWGGLRC
eukprot:7377338-Prymnesium_polylepis.2